MGRKRWRTLSDTTLQKGAAAWQFFRHYCSNNLSAGYIKHNFGKLAQLAVSMTVLHNKTTGFMGYCLGNQVWAALLWPLRDHPKSLPHDSRKRYFCLASDESAAAELHFFYKPDDWEVLAHEIEVDENQVVLECDMAESEALLRRFLREPALVKNISKNDLMMICEVFSMAPAFGDLNLIKQMPQNELLLSIIQHASNEDDDYIQEMRAKLLEGKTGPPKSTADDQDDLGGLLDELVLLDLPKEEHRDFDEVAKAIEKKNKDRWNEVEKAKKAKKAKAKSKPNSKPKASQGGRPLMPPSKFVKSVKRRRKRALPALQDIPSDPAGNVTFTYVAASFSFFLLKTPNSQRWLNFYSVTYYIYIFILQSTVTE